MMLYLSYILGVLLVFATSCLIYYTCNKGMASYAKGQQTRRFLIGTVVVWAPFVVAGVNPLQLGIITAWIVGFLWALCYPLLYHITYRKSSPDYENYGDISCGMYFFGLLAALWTIGAGYVAALIEYVVLVILLAQVVYGGLYGTCVDVNGMKLMHDTNPNEVIEFAKSYPWWKVVLVSLFAVSLLVLLFVVNADSPMLWNVQPVEMTLLSVASVFFGWYIIKPRRGMLVRSGIVRLWLDVKEYAANNQRYLTEMELRLKDLHVTPLGTPFKRPSTIILVVGESGSRDHMSAFKSMEYDTTPWMREMAQDATHSVIYRNAYSCTMHTVQVLEKSLTEYNQYNGKQFYDSCSVIDVAHQLGYQVHWFSNQGILGASDTPITLVANTSDVAKWTSEDLGKVQYDEALLSFLDELDPEQNNLVVFHLMGSHFNFLSRYPSEATVWGEPDVQDDVLNYYNSLHYTDTLLKHIYEYATEKLNLQAMVYFSDHATIPDRHRSPNFDGFGNVRIPLFVTMSDEYLACHPERAEALKANRERYWTNDLLYELMCGLFDVHSNHYDEQASLASASYKYQRDDLLTYEGKARIADDN